MVDVRGHGLTILKRINLKMSTYLRSIQETGLKFVNAQDRSSANFTGQMELAHLLYEVTKHDVHFGESIVEMQEACEAVTVIFQKGNPGRFDIVIGADHWASRTRKLAFGADESSKAVRALGKRAAWYTIPQDSEDDQWVKWCTVAGRRMILTRSTSG